MTQDARFEDGIERPVRLAAETVEDLAVISALVQDSVLKAGDIAWMPRRRRLALLLARFRWEDAARAERDRRPYERVRAMLVADDVMSVRSRGVDPAAPDRVLSILHLGFEATDPPAGRLSIHLAGGGRIEAEAGCLDIRLRDVTRPYRARAARAPSHEAD